MTNIYDQHRAAFAAVSAFVVLDQDGKRVATVAIKFPRDGAGRLYAYVHVMGTEMARGWAGGGGYDKRTAAVCSAIRSIKPSVARTEPHYQNAEYIALADAVNSTAASFRAAVTDNGTDWTRGLEDAGYTVLQAV